MALLADKNCVPCKGDLPPLKGHQLPEMLAQLSDREQWNVVREHHLLRTYPFPDFKSALTFVNRIGELAEQQGHHPDILLSWGKVEVKIWTHSIDGLTESDFILAAKIGRLPR